jgi:hypothetical protein
MLVTPMLLWPAPRVLARLTQSGNKLAGASAVKSALRSSSIASGDGRTALVGRPADNNFVGAAWVFTRSDAWVQAEMAPRIVGSW